MHKCILKSVCINIIRDIICYLLNLFSAITHSNTYITIFKHWYINFGISESYCIFYCHIKMFK